MNEKQKKQIISLATIMVICIILTSLIFGNSLQCHSCEKKITGKYYITLSGYPYCKDCGTEYYRGFPGSEDNITDKVNNTFRNILILVELVGFIGAIVVTAKKASKTQIRLEEYDIQEEDMLINSPDEDDFIIPLNDKEDLAVTLEDEDFDAFAEEKEFAPVLKEEPEPVSPSKATEASRIKTTFSSKPKTEDSAVSSSEKKGDWFKSAGDL